MSGPIQEHTVVVTIFGEEYPITGVGDPGHIVRVADFVNARMKDVARVSRSKAKDKIAILTALSLASELLERSDDVSRLEHHQDDKVDSLLHRLDEVLATVSPES